MSDWETYYFRLPWTRKQTPPPQPVLDLREMMETLIPVSDETWGRYAFRRELLRRRLTEEQKQELTRGSLSCGAECARSMAADYGTRNPAQIALERGAAVSFPRRPGGGKFADRILFAQFTEPDKLEVFTDCIEKAGEVIEEQGLNALFGLASIRDILLAHELFHLIEFQERATIFTQTQRIDLWSLKIIHNRSRVLCLGEIAGMRFTRELLGLDFSPYIMDVFLLYLYRPQAASDLYRSLLKILFPPDQPGSSS
jgi:hypothetical protein